MGLQGHNSCTTIGKDISCKQSRTTLTNLKVRTWFKCLNNN